MVILLILLNTDTLTKALVMNDNDTLHLWFKPYGNTLSEGDMSFVERYSKRFYPRAMSDLATQLRKLMTRITKVCPPGTFQYQLTHYTRKNTSRYVIEESLQDISDDSGLRIGIQASNPEERVIFSDCFADETNNTTQPVQNVVAYLKDSLEMESHKWENAKMSNGCEALTVLNELINFLKAVKNFARVHTFELTQTESGMDLTIALISPSVLAYYTRIDWKIV